MLYLDNSATTQVHPEVMEAMIPFLTTSYGNPSSKYYSLADNARNAVAESRDKIASLLGCDSDEITFTSGSTESNNMIIKGIVDQLCNGENHHIVTTLVEHSSVFEVFEYLKTKGFRVTYLEVDSFGRISLDRLKELIINDPPILVSVIWGNNEVGSLNDMKAISSLCEENSIYLHSDATQIVGKVEFSLDHYPGINFLSCSAHKFCGPKGVGVAVIRKNTLGLPTKITPLLHGGEQESGIRGGTYAVHNIVGMGKAAEIAQNKLLSNISNLNSLETVLLNILHEKLGESISINNDSKNKIPGVLSVQFKGINNEMLVKKLSPFIAVSTGSACSSSKPSRILQALGLSMEEIRSTVRISLSPNIESAALEIFYQL